VSELLESLDHLGLEGALWRAPEGPAAAVVGAPVLKCTVTAVWTEPLHSFSSFAAAIPFRSGSLICGMAGTSAQWQQLHLGGASRGCCSKQICGRVAELCRGETLVPLSVLAGCLLVLI